jgi:hypothetical protein
VTYNLDLVVQYDRFVYGAPSVVCQAGALADIRWPMTGKRRTSVV